MILAGKPPFCLVSFRWAFRFARPFCLPFVSRKERKRNQLPLFSFATLRRRNRVCVGDLLAKSTATTTTGRPKDVATDRVKNRLVSAGSSNRSVALIDDQMIAHWPHIGRAEERAAHACKKIVNQRARRCRSRSRSRSESGR